MKPLRYSILFLLFFICANFGQFKQLNGLNCGNINALVQSGNRLIAGTDAGLFISVDTGQTWYQNKNDLSSSKITKLAVKDSVLYAAINSAVFFTRDYGLNWQRAGLDVTPLFLFIKGDMVYSGIVGGISVSKLNTHDWNYSPYNSGNYDSYFSYAVIDSVIVVAGNRGTLVSYDNCKTWISNPTSFYIHDISSIGPYLFAATNIGIYSSINYGFTWEKKYPTETYSLLAFDDKLYAKYYAPSDNGIWKDGILCSSDWGETWTKQFTDFSFNSFLGQYMNRLFVKGNPADYSFNFENNSWSIFGTPNCIVNDIEIYRNEMIAAVPPVGVMKENKVNKTWNIMPKIYDVNITSLAVNDSTIFAGTYSGPFYLPDKKNEWLRAGYINSGGETRSILYVNNTLFVATVSGLYKSFNNGAEWFKPTEIGWRPAKKLYNYGSNIYAGLYAGGFLSTDFGMTWKSFGPEGKLITSMAFNGKNLFVSNSWGEVFLSSDMGAKWLMINNGEFHSTVNTLAVYDSVVFAGTSDEGLFVYPSLNGGWKKVGLDKTGIQVIRILNDTLYAGTNGKGIFYAKVNELIKEENIEEPANEIPEDFSLNQNYPNPFNSSTIINYKTPFDCYVKLQLYSVSGQLVKTLIDGKTVAGTHYYYLNSDELSAGIYIYRMIAGDKTISKKMVVLK